MRRSRLTLQKIYSLVQKYLKQNPLVRLRQRGRPRSYNDTLILTLWLGLFEKSEIREKTRVRRDNLDKSISRNHLCFDGIQIYF